MGDCAGLLGSSQGSWSTACTSSSHIPACVGGKMCCRGCFVCAHEMFTLTKFDLCFCNFRKRQMALRKTWSLQQVFEVLLPFLSLWVKSPGVKIPHYSSIFPDLGPAFIAVSKASAGLGEQRFCCSLTAWAGAAAQRVLGRWPHTAPP